MLDWRSLLQCSGCVNTCPTRRIHRHSKPTPFTTTSSRQGCGEISQHQLHPARSLDETIDAFLQSRAEQPVTRSLRRDCSTVWRCAIAGIYSWRAAADATDPTLVCQRLAGRLATGDTTGLADAALARWSLAQRQPQPCTPVFTWLRAQGVLTPALAEARTRAALLADNPHLAREFAADVPPVRATALLRWADLIEAPKSALNVLATHPTLPIESDALTAGFDKLSHSDPGAALSMLPALLRRDGLDAATGERLKRARRPSVQSYDRDPRAVSAFADLTEENTDSLAQEWRVRAALWAGDWIKALTWIKLMPPALATQPRWQYWHARAVEMTTGADFAAPLYAASRRSSRPLWIPVGGTPASPVRIECPRIARRRRCPSDCSPPTPA